LALAACMVAAGCAHVEPIAYQEATKAELIGRLKAEAAMLAGYRANEVRVDIKGPETKRSATGWFAFRLPLSLRLQLESWGYDFLVLSDGATVYIVTPEKEEGGLKQVVYEGRATDEHTFRPVDIISALGVIGVEAADDIRIEKYPESYVLLFLGLRTDEGGVRKRVTIERVHLRVARVQTFDRQGRLFMEAALEDYRPVKLSGGGVVAVAHDVRIDWPEAETRLRLRLKDIDDVVDPRMFVFDKATYGPENGYEWRRMRELP